MLASSGARAVSRSRAWSRKSRAAGVPNGAITENELLDLAEHVAGMQVPGFVDDPFGGCGCGVGFAHVQGAVAWMVVRWARVRLWPGWHIPMDVTAQSSAFWGWPRSR